MHPSYISHVYKRAISTWCIVAARESKKNANNAWMPLEISQRSTV